MTFFSPLAPSNAVYSSPDTPDGNTLIKAHVSGYTRGDGTRVQPHERSTAAARAATGSATAAASRNPAEALAALAREHAGHCARHEALAAKRGREHPHHGLHIELAALHQASARCVRRGVAAKTSAERTATMHAYAHLEKRIAETGRAFSLPKQQMAKAEAPRPVLFLRKSAAAVGKAVKTLASVRPRVPDLSRLIAEMDAARRRHAQQARTA
ncbi:hypothetical protein C6568_17425 [Melaminivora suipulveris]|uniref:Uncharacterized protein n=1 Tax=Melaminivora suipulveris TaxID=2109913 RepID=A0A2R3QGB3_9BURK|nr:hypothetical protein [Melaminivora suipulveris]AVO50806.1 hypothetical protein C6568_17425 [Melaminivora suipulveris]